MFNKKKEETLDDSIFQMEVLDSDSDESEQVEPPKKKKGNKKFLALMIAGAVGVSAIFGVAAYALTPKAVQKVRTTAVEKGSIRSYLDTSGTINSLDVKTYFSPVNAPVNSATLKVGQVVTEGQQLVTFDVTNLEQDNQKADLTAAATIYGNQDSLNKAQEAKAKAAEAEVQIQSLESQIAQWQQYVLDCNNYITRRTAQLTDEGNNISLQIEQLGNQISELTSQQQQLDTQYAQDPTNATYLQTRANIQASIDATNQNIYDLKIQLNSVSNPSGNDDIIYYNNEITNAQNTISQLQSDLAEQESIKSAGDTADVSAEAQAQMEANSNLASLESSSIEELVEKGKRGIKAEFAGVITNVSGAIQGTTAAQGMELVTVSSTQEVAVDVTVTKNDYDKVKEGQKATITMGEKEYQGTVTSVSRVATQNEKGVTVLNATVKIDNPDTDIFLGIEAKVQIDLGAADNVLVAPMEIINTDVDGTFCYVLENGVVARRSIEIGDQEGDQVEIVSGLTETDTVIPTLPDNVAVGDTVQPMTKAEEEAQDAYQQQIEDALQMYQ